MSKYCVYYNDIEDQLYITAKGHTAWCVLNYRQKVTISVYFIPTENCWHFIGEL